MNLQETTKALEAKGITVAITLGVHQHCAIDSNCPIAVELRRLVVDAGVTLEQLLEGYEAVTATDPVNYDLPEVSSKVSISVAGKTMEFELDDIVSTEMKSALDERFRAVDGRLRHIRRLGDGLYNSYLTAIRRARENTTLPQLSFSRRELIEAGCLTSCDGDKYLFLFPNEYKPEYLVRDGIRYKIADEDIETIKRDVILEFVVRDERFLSAKLYNITGRGLQHYHGTATDDCWGNVSIPRRWDGRLRSLQELSTLIMRSLATINLNSLMSNQPPDMPHKDSLMDRATEMGREGEMETQEEATPAEGWATGEEEPRTGWGRGRRTGRTPAPPAEEVDLDGEMMRRYGRTGTDGDHETICALCGERLGHHYGMRAEVCPRDRR